MTDEQKPIGDYWVLDRLIGSLQERAKELNCIYRVGAILTNPDEPIGRVCPLLIEAIPTGWQYPKLCQVKIVIEDNIFATPNFIETPWLQSADIAVQDIVIGSITVSYREETPSAAEKLFLADESRLLKTIAERLGYFICHQKMRQITEEWQTVRPEVSVGRPEWQVVLKLLRDTDRELYQTIARKMLNHLCWSGIAEAEKLLRSFTSNESLEDEENPEHWNRPHQRKSLVMSAAFSSAAFKIAADHLDAGEILNLIQKWIQEDKLGFLVQAVNRNLTLSEVADAIRRYQHLTQDEPVTLSSSMRGIQVSLIRRFLSDQQQYINVAKNYVDVADFCKLIQNLIYTSESYGRLGGKSAGFFLAKQILLKKAADNELLANVQIPKTWYITSDVILYYMHYNNMDDVVEQKYKDIGQIRREYPHVVQSFKNARFPADIIKGLSMALDDLGDRPLIVRSSSLLEDRVGAAFSGKYKSLFLANRGSKQQRLDALTDAIAEVYASTFGPDPIEYRAERGLIDFAEEMGIIIQEVVGRRIGKYFLPSFAGVAFSNNEFRWSPRIRRTDGLIRLVPGLGTRAVDRLSNDYPILIAPGQPTLRTNVTPDEIARYSPKYIDVINLETEDFETIPLLDFLREVNFEVPGIQHMLSLSMDGRLVAPGLTADISSGAPVVTFDGLVSRTRFLKRLRAIMQTLEVTLGEPVDIEFACDGDDFYLLQCRAQSYSAESAPAPIPKDIPMQQIVFSANRYVSNGRVPDVTHVVYVDPRKYAEIEDRATLVAVGRAVSRLNKLLPKRKFILIGPGRWGSRGDIKLGVNVTYSDINNTSMLIEVAIRHGNYVPDLSFGTHFFQDLVEANIRYLPLFPGDDHVVFSERFLTEAPSVLPELLPECDELAEVIRVIDIPQATGGKVLSVLMNADLDEAVGILTPPGGGLEIAASPAESPAQVRGDFWRWRLQMAEQIAARIDPVRFGVAALYLIGSAKNANAGPDSDIDLLVHFRGSPEQRQDLVSWLEGWSLSLDEVNFIRTGYRTGGLVDVHMVTDDEVARPITGADEI
ncbi:MAG TPA: PEP/pyruvate-binding domain-containing protein, partial [candidate division Zixibacteria bacterium]|nr:PEP/pyruvate-binding domain-containing protein [candidate division Zixibacteria bacterium]